MCQSIPLLFQSNVIYGIDDVIVKTRDVTEGTHDVIVISCDVVDETRVVIDKTTDVIYETPDVIDIITDMFYETRNVIEETTTRTQNSGHPIKTKPTPRDKSKVHILVSAPRTKRRTILNHKTREMKKRGEQSSSHADSTHAKAPAYPPATPKLWQECCTPAHAKKEQRIGCPSRQNTKEEQSNNRAENMGTGANTMFIQCRGSVQRYRLFY